MRITFFDWDNYAFSPEELWGKGIGGSEYALVSLAEALSEMGHKVTMAVPVKQRAVYGGVQYVPWASYGFEPVDLFVVFRHPHSRYGGGNGGHKTIFFSCDQYTTRDWNTTLQGMDRIITISSYHRDYLASHYPICTPDKLRMVPIGARTQDYEDYRGLKVPYRMIFCSVPARGLDPLLDMWPRIRRAIPEATLTITADYKLWGFDAGNIQWVKRARPMEGINFLGTIPREQLIKEQLAAEVMAYPCTYEENFCIAAMECIAAGAVPVTYDIGAMAETVSPSGIVLKGAPVGLEKQTEYIDALVGLIKDRPRLAEMAKTGRYRAMCKYSYRAVAQRFLEACE